MDIKIDKTRSRIIREEIGFAFADIVIKFENKQKVEMDARGLKLMLLTMLKEMYGDDGLAIPCDILKFDENLLRAYIRFPTKYITQVRSSLTLCSNYKNLNCSIIILKVCHSLSYLPLELNKQQHNIELKY